MSGEFDDPALYDRLKTALDEIGAPHGIPPNYLFYLAIPPDLFATVGRHLAAAGLADETRGLAARHRREAVRLRPRERARRSMPS